MAITSAKLPPLPESQTLRFSELKDYWLDYTRNGRDNEAARRLCWADRFFLLIAILKRGDAFRPWIYGRCREVEASPDDHLDLWAREHYKSTIITFAGIIQEVLRDPEITVAIFSHTKPIAKAFLRQIQREFEANLDLKTLFPDILWSNPEKEARQWSLDGGITVKRKSNPKEATIEAHGLVDGQPTSRHFRLRVYNDVVVPESVYTPEQIERTTEAWSLSDNLGMEGGRRWHEGTRYDHDPRHPGQNLPRHRQRSRQRQSGAVEQAGVGPKAPDAVRVHHRLPAAPEPAGGHAAHVQC
jgi:hypothetical protein